MAKKNKGTYKKEKAKNIETIGSEVICREIKIQMTNEKLKNILMRTYEHARNDAAKKHVRDYWDVFLSVSGSLLLAIITADFKSIGQVPKEIVTIVVWGIFILSSALAIINFIIKYSTHDYNVNTERDIAIENVMQEIIKNNVLDK